MTIKAGDSIPSVTVKKMGAAGLEDFNLADHIAGKRAILFAVPGAFTPTCHQKHLPGYVAKADEIKSKGIDEIICIAVNDPFVMAHWEEVSGAKGKVTLVPDGNAAFTREIGMDFDGSGAGLSVRSKRYAMIVENGIVKDIQIEEAPGALALSGAEACLLRV